MVKIPFTTLKEADDRSRQMWAQCLGRAKNPQDVTEYLYGRTVGRDEDNNITGITLDIPAKDAYLDKLITQDKLTTTEKAELEKVGWVTPKVAPVKARSRRK